MVAPPPPQDSTHGSTAAEALPALHAAARRTGLALRGFSAAALLFGTLAALYLLGQAAAAARGLTDPGAALRAFLAPLPAAFACVAAGAAAAFVLTAGRLLHDVSRGQRLAALEVEAQQRERERVAGRLLAERSQLAEALDRAAALERALMEHGADQWVSAVGEALRRELPTLVEALREQGPDLRPALAEIGAAVDALRSGLEALRSTADALGRDIGLLRREVEGLRPELGTLQREADRVGTGFQALRAEGQALRVEARSARAALELMQAEVRSLGSALAAPLSDEATAALHAVADEVTRGLRQAAEEGRVALEQFGQRVQDAARAEVQALGDASTQAVRLFTGVSRHLDKTWEQVQESAGGVRASLEELRRVKGHLDAMAVKLISSEQRGREGADLLQEISAKLEALKEAWADQSQALERHLSTSRAEQAALSMNIDRLRKGLEKLQMPPRRP